MSLNQQQLTRIALVCMTPTVDSNEHGGVELPSYGIRRILAAVVADPRLVAVETRLIDLERPDVTAYVDALASFEPQLVGMSLFVWSTPTLISVARLLKQRLPDCTIVFGGPSARPELLDLPCNSPSQEYVDAVVTRDGEQTFCDIAVALNTGRQTEVRQTLLSKVAGLQLPAADGWIGTGTRPRSPRLDQIASPYQMGLMNYGAVGYLESFRGCPMSCTFCEWGSADIAQGTFSKEYLVRELESLAAHAAPAVFNVDAGLNLNAQAFRNLAAAEQEVGFLRETGLWCEIYPAKITDDHLQFLSACGPSYLGVGLQSLNPDVLRRLQRPFGRERFESAIRQLAMVAHNIEVQIIFGLPTDSWDGFIQTLEYSLSLPVTVRVYHCLVLPDALLTRGLPEWRMHFDPDTLSMRSCAGWSEQQLLEMRELLSREAMLCGGTWGKFWWSFPPPNQRQTIPRLSTERFVPCGAAVAGGCDE